MSGLTVFFQQQLGISNASYHTSLQEVTPPHVGNPSPVEDEDSEEDSIFDDVEKTWTFNAWRAKRNAILEEFMNARIAGEIDEIIVQRELKDDEEKETEEEFATQQAAPMPVDVDGDGRKAAAAIDPLNHIPHEDATVHKVMYLADMDLSTKSLTVDFCRVNKFWSLRKGKRNKAHRAIPFEPVRYQSAPQLVRLSVRGIEDDGPMWTCYRQVIVLEVTQLDSAPSEMRRRALYLQERPNVQRVKIFFYNAYASILESIWQQRPADGKAQLFLQLNNVPARCIIPYGATDWFDRQDQSTCCICIGDNSNMSMDESVKLRMDSEHLSIAIGWVHADDIDSLREWNVRPVPEQGAIATQVDEESGPIRSQYRRWKVRNTAREAPETTATATEAAQGTGVAGSVVQPKVNNQGEVSIRTPGRENIADSRNRNVDHVQRDTRPSSHRKERVKYDKLNDLRLVLESHLALARGDGAARADPCVVNVFGAVLGFGSPAMTKRGDWMVGVALIDESLPLECDSGPIHTVNINIFAKEKSSLPSIQRAGDVVRLHRVNLQQWKEEIQLMGMRASSYVVFRGDSDEPTREDAWKVIPTANSKFQMTLADERRFQELWMWASTRFIEHPSMTIAKCFKVGDMNSPYASTSVPPGFGGTEFGDLTVMVTAISPLVANQQTYGISPRGFLRVWDGTGPSESDPFPPGFAPQLSDPPAAVLVRMASLVQQIRALNAGASVEAPKAVVGRVANVAVWENSHWDLVQAAVTVGSFIRLRNVQESTLDATGMQCLMVYSKSYLTPLPDLTYESIRLMEDHAARIARNDPFNRNSAVLPLQPGEVSQQYPTESGAEAAGTVASPGPQVHPGAATREKIPVKDNVLELLRGAVPTVFEGPVRIVDTFPTMLTLYSLGIENICCATEKSIHVYRFAVEIEDRTGKLTAILSDAGGAAIVGMKAEDALRDKAGALFNLRSTINDRGLWQARVRSIERNGEKYFVVEAISEASGAVL